MIGCFPSCRLILRQSFRCRPLTQSVYQTASKFRSSRIANSSKPIWPQPFLNVQQAAIAFYRDLSQFATGTKHDSGREPLSNYLALNVRSDFVVSLTFNYNS